MKRQLSILDFVMCGILIPISYPTFNRVAGNSEVIGTCYVPDEITLKIPHRQGQMHMVPYASSASRAGERTALLYSTDQTLGR